MRQKQAKLKTFIEVRKGSYITKKDAVPGPYPVILGGREPAYYINKFNHEGEAIVVSRSGASAGYVSFWNEPIFITDGFLIEGKPCIDYHFLYYLLKSKQNELNGLQRGAAIPHVTPSLINDVDVHVPPIEEQRRIASILKAYDNLIENNRRQIALLEEAAQRLYKEWFVDLRFPGYESTAIVCGIPNGWRQCGLNEIVTFHRGFDLPRNNMVAGTYPVVGSTSVIGYHNKFKISGPGVVTGRSGTLGHHQLIWDDFWPHNTSLYISDYKCHHFLFVYAMISQLDFTLLGGGAAVPTLNRNVLSGFRVLEPPVWLQDEFVRTAEPFYKKIRLLNLQSQSAQEARDRLLPKLMSGEILG